MRAWYERYFGADYWVYAGAEYTPERTAAEADYLADAIGTALGAGQSTAVGAGAGFDAVPGTRVDIGFGTDRRTGFVDEPSSGSGSASDRWPGSSTGSSPGSAGRPRVLDVGCGIGRHAVELARRGFDVVGVDVSPWALDRAREAACQAGVPLRLVEMDALTAGAGDWPVTSVDAVVCVQAFGWGTDAQQLSMLRALRRLLEPGGVLVLDHSNVSAILRMYSARSVAAVAGHTFEFLRRYDQLTGRSGGVLRVCRPDGSTVELPDDVRLYQPQEVAALLRAAGFEVCRADADFRVGAAVGMDTRYVQFVARAPGWPASALAGHGAPVPAGTLDLRWAPDEADFVADALAEAWREATSPPAAPATPAAKAANVTFAASNEPNVTFAALLADRARHYGLGDPYAAQRCAGVLSAQLGVPLPAEQVTAGAGATGLLRALATLAVGGTVLVDPTGHPELALAAREVGAGVRALPLATLPAAVAAVREVQPAVTVLDRPGVAGRVWPMADVRMLASATAECGGVLVVDETCASYLPPAETATGQDVRGLVVVRSMSKGYCCGGLRVGFAVSSPDLAERVRAVCPPLAAGALALDLAVALLRRDDPLAGLRTRVLQVKPRFVELLAAAGIDVEPGDPRLPWVTVAAGVPLAGIAGKAVPVAPGRPELVRLSVPLSEERWQAAVAALGGGP